MEVDTSPTHQCPPLSPPSLTGKAGAQAVAQREQRSRDRVDDGNGDCGAHHLRSDDQVRLLRAPVEALLIILATLLLARLVLSFRTFYS